MSINNVEKFRAKMARGEVAIGIVIGFSDPQVSELAADAGYDFTWIDMEHGALTLPIALGHVMACRGTDTAPLIRVPSHDPVLIKPIIELFPAGVIVPRIQTRKDVETAVAACRYPPRGIRGYGPQRGVVAKGMDTQAYLKDPDSEPMVFVQIEDIEAVNNIDAILGVEGLAGICFGPNDLSGTMGKLGNPGAPEVVAKIDLVCARCRKAGKLLGTSVGFSAASYRDWMAKGVQWISLNCDFANLYARSRAVLDEARAIRAE